MANVTYDKEITALLVIDPYNDFISDGGKVWDRLKTAAEAADPKNADRRFACR
jgi:ureidoacrylate peracid hydrolase